MTNRLRNSASPASTWLGGIVGRPKRVPGQRQHDDDLGEARAQHEQRRGDRQDREQQDDASRSGWACPRRGRGRPRRCRSPWPGGGAGRWGWGLRSASGSVPSPARGRPGARPTAAPGPPPPGPRPARPGRPARSRARGGTTGRAAAPPGHRAGGQPRRVVHSRNSSTRDPSEPAGPAGAARGDVLGRVHRLRLLLELAQHRDRGLGDADEQQLATGADDGEAGAAAEAVTRQHLDRRGRLAAARQGHSPAGAALTAVQVPREEHQQQEHDGQRDDQPQQGPGERAVNHAGSCRPLGCTRAVGHAPSRPSWSDETISEMRTANSSSMTTTSPRAIRVPLTSRSTGAPAALSSSTIAPGVRASSSRTVIRVRPSSTLTPIIDVAQQVHPAGVDAGRLAGGQRREHRGRGGSGGRGLAARPARSRRRHRR